MDIFVRNLKIAGETVFTFIKWILAAALIGIIGAGIGGGFHLILDFAGEVRAARAYIMLMLPVAGLFIAAIYHTFDKDGNFDTNCVIDAVNTESRVPLMLAPVIFVSTALTHLFGGSAGREGAAIQLGGSIGYNVGKGLRLNSDDSHIAVMTGAAAVFTALFGTPLAAAVLALEVSTVGKMHYKALVPCAVGATVSYAIALWMGVQPVRFVVDFGIIGAGDYVRGAVLALLCAAVGILFCVSMRKTGHLMRSVFKNAFLRAFAGGVIIVALTLILRTYDYNGAGMQVIEKAMQGKADWYAFLLKIVFTAITLGAGFKGGEIVPAFFIGSTFGCSVAPLLGLNPVLGAAIGFIALFCSCVNCPLASLFLAIEVFGGQGIGIFLLVCAISFMLSGDFSLYRSQRKDY